MSPVVALGARPTFYSVGRDLQPDLADLEASIDRDTRAVVLIHYLGVAGPVDEMRRLCDARGVALIEDCAHALFSRLDDRLLGSFGEAAIFSPWKSLPLPDGGVLALNRPSLKVDVRLPRPPWTVTARRLAYRSIGAAEMAVGWSPRSTLLRRSGLRRNLHAWTSGAPVRILGASGVARRLLAAARPERVVARRRQNYLRLLDAVGRLSWCRPIFDRLPDGACPLGLPLVAEQRDRRRDELLAAGVNVRTYWEELPAEVAQDRHPDAAWLRDRILVLPVHQALRSEQVDWLAERLGSVGARKGYGARTDR